SVITLARRRRWDCLQRRMLLDIAVDHVLQLFAGLEEGNFFGGNFYPVTGLWIASHARFTLASAKASEAANLDFIAGAQGAHHALKNRFNDNFAVFPGEFCQPGNFVDQVRLRHPARPLLVQSPARLGTTDTLKFPAPEASISLQTVSVPPAAAKDARTFVY